MVGKLPVKLFQVHYSMAYTNKYMYICMYVHEQMISGYKFYLIIEIWTEHTYKFMTKVHNDYKNDI